MNISSPEEKTIIMKDAPAPYYNDDGVLIMSVYDFLLNEGKGQLIDGHIRVQLSYHDGY